MEEGLDLAQSQQRRLVGGRFREIHHHTDVRTDVFALPRYPLPLIIGHPRAALLAFSRMEIGVEHGEIRTVFVEHLVGFHVGMIDGNRLVFLERDAVESRGEGENAVDDFFESEIGSKHLGIEVIAFHLQLVGVEREVPGLHLS